jgi:hypothetical protein
MNAKILLATAAIAAAVSGIARADDITIEPAAFVSSKTRAEVNAELAQYKQGGVNPWSTSYNPLNAFRGSRTRAEVTGEYIANRDEVRALGAEDSGSAYLAAQQAHRAVQMAGENQATH